MKVLRMKWSALVLALLMTALGATGCSGGSGDASASLVGYRTGSHDRDLVLVVETGPQDTLGVGEVVSEDATHVKVDLKMRRASDTQPLQAIRHEVTVTLRSPLGGREVQSPTGRAISQLPN